MQLKSWRQFIRRYPIRSFQTVEPLSSVHQCLVTKEGFVVTIGNIWDYFRVEKAVYDCVEIGQRTITRAVVENMERAQLTIISLVFIFLNRGSLRYCSKAE